MKKKNPGIEVDWRNLRLKDRIARDLCVLFVGINPGVRSAILGHHFAGFSNRFWKLLFESGLTPEPVSFRDDRDLLQWGLGITNLIARPSPGIDDLTAGEYVEGWSVLERKIRRYRPQIVALVGVTLYRAILPHLPGTAPIPAGSKSKVVGPQPLAVHGARIFVLPNPSGRNAHFSYRDMLKAYTQLRQSIPRAAPRCRPASS